MHAALVLYFALEFMGDSPGVVGGACEVGEGHSPTLPSLHLRHSSFSNPSVASPTSRLILKPFRSPTSQALDLRHLASCQC